MATFKIEKVVSALPGTLVADTVYAVRTGSGFDLYITDSTGTVAHLVNSSGGGGGGTQNTYIQQTDPLASSPYIWYKTDATGKVIDILKG